MCDSDITIDLPKTQFVAGEQLAGRVIFDVKKKLNIYGIYILFHGYEQKTDAFTGRLIKKRWTVEGKATLFGNECSLDRDVCGSAPSEDQGIELKNEKYSWKFSLNIPENIPPSLFYEEGRVQVAYYVKVVVDIPWGTNLMCQESVSIVTPYKVDLSDRRPSQIKEKSYMLRGSNNYHKRQVLSMDVQLQREVTFPGDNLVMNVLLDNNSGRAVAKLKYKLKQVVDNVHITTICKDRFRDDSFPLHQSQWNGNVKIEIPERRLLPTVTNSSLVQISYYITVRARIWPAGDVKVRLPVIMSTVPPVVSARGASEVSEKKKTIQKKKKQTKKQTKSRRNSTVDESIINDTDSDALSDGELSGTEDGEQRKGFSLRDSVSSTTSSSSTSTSEAEFSPVVSPTPPSRTVDIFSNLIDFVDMSKQQPLTQPIQPQQQQPQQQFPLLQPQPQVVYQPVVYQQPQQIIGFAPQQQQPQQQPLSQAAMSSNPFLQPQASFASYPAYPMQSMAQPVMYSYPNYPAQPIH